MYNASNRLTCVSSSMSLEVKCVVETFSTEAAKIPFQIGVTFHVSVQEALQCKYFGADAAA